MNTDKKAEFLKIWAERVYRASADAMLDWLERGTDFSRPRPPPGTTVPTLAACWNTP